MATMQSPSLNRLIKEARIMLNQPSGSNSFWSDEELTSYLNDAVSMYYQEVSERSEGQFDKVTTIDIVSGVETIDLPSDCFEVKALYVLQDTIYQILAYRNNLTESYDANPSATDAGVYNPYYYFRGNQLVLRPIPNFNLTAGFKLEYISFPETMIWGGDTLTSGIAPIFKEIIVLYAVYKAKVKESLTTGNNTHAAVQGLLSDCYIRFQNSIGQRSKYPLNTLAFNPETY